MIGYHRVADAVTYIDELAILIVIVLIVWWLGDELMAERRFAPL